MRILFITYHYLNGKGGGVFASRAYINAFAEIAEKMTLLFPIKDAMSPTGINSKVELIPVEDKRSNLSKGIGWIVGRTNRYWPIDKYLNNFDYDIVVFDTSMVTPGIINQIKKKGIKIITIHHNFQYEYYRDNTRGLLRKPILFWTNRFEQESVHESDLNLTLTQADLKLLLEHYGGNENCFEVLGTFEYERRAHEIVPDVIEPRFLITGNLRASQSENSLLPWIDDYYPILKKYFPDATLTLAGKSPSDRLIAKAKQHGIDIISSPESMLPILAQAKYYICATSLGGGLKLRVMDGLQAGLPVLCHSVSARGYEVFAEKGLLLVYNDQASFCKQLEKLKTIKVNKQEAIAVYEEFFSFESGLLRLKKLMLKHHLLNE